MLENAEKALDFVGRMEYEEFLEDEKTSYAVVRALEIIGEAILGQLGNIRFISRVEYWSAWEDGIVKFVGATS